MELCYEVVFIFFHHHIVLILFFSLNVCSTFAFVIDSEASSKWQVRYYILHLCLPRDPVVTFDFQKYRAQSISVVLFLEYIFIETENHVFQKYKTQSIFIVLFLEYIFIETENHVFQKYKTQSIFIVLFLEYIFIETENHCFSNHVMFFYRTFF